MSGISDLLGLELLEVRVDDDEGKVSFLVSDGRAFDMLHHQDCCEHVYLEDVCGDLSDLLESVITEAEEVSGETAAPAGWKDDGCESYTWTFYKIGTRKGSVTMRWFGSSNGYYSESVDFCERELSIDERARIRSFGESRGLERDVTAAAGGAGEGRRIRSC